MKVYGNYTSEVAAATAIQELNTKGYSRSSIKVLTSRSLGPEFDTVDTVDVTDASAKDLGDRGLFTKIRDFFSFDKYDDDYYAGQDDDMQSVLSSYRTNLDNGEIIILLKDEGPAPHTEDNSDLHTM